MNKYPKYTWVGNRIAKEDMERLYHMKQATRKPITMLVSEAVKAYVAQQEGQQIGKDTTNK
mgnify:CR=1 FL=1